MSLLPGKGRVRMEDKGRVVYVRMEACLGLDVLAALDKANPAGSESVLNSGDVTEPELSRQ